MRRVSRNLSRRAVVETILKCGPISRASVAKQTHLSKQTISEIVRQLEDEGWVAETGRTIGHVGRTALTYEMVPSAAYIAAIDLGGTKVRIGISDLAGRFEAEAIELTDSRGVDHVIGQIVRMCREAAEAGGLDQARLRLAVVGVPGAPDPATGSIRMAPNIAGFDTMDVASAFERAFGFDVVLENDVNLAALGEAWQGAGRNVDDLAYIALGTGIGSGLIVSGELVRGSGNAAGELGFLPIGTDPFEAESRRCGAFERAVASAGIRGRYATRAGAVASVPEIFERASAGEEHALAVLGETARLLAAGIAAICAVVNPQKIILGGSIGARPELIAEVRNVLPLCLASPVDVEVSVLGPHAALAGAAAVGLGLLQNTLFGAGAPESRISLPRPRSDNPASAAGLGNGPMADQRKSEVRSEPNRTSEDVRP